MKDKVDFGDYVEIHLGKKEYQGYLLKNPEGEKGIILLKLDSGYNIGIHKKDIINLKLIKKFSRKEDKTIVKKDKDKPNIAMIITGGTIASRYDSRTGGVHPLTDPKELFKSYPEIFEKVNVLKVEVPFRKASEDTDFKDWKKIAKAAEKLLNDSNVSGVIITHGTDYLHYASSALSFFLKNINKPVVLTYSQKSIDRASSDANLNLRCSALAAISDVAEVMVVGHGSINDDFCNAIPGTKARKLHSSRRDAFKAVNSKPFAKIFPDRIELESTYNLRDNSKKVKADISFEEKVAIVRVYPGQSPDILDFYHKKKYKGIVLETSGLGHVPGKNSRTSWIKKLTEVQEKGMIICATSQTIFGKVDPLVYSNGREILKTGVIYLEDMLAETALVKLGWVLGHREWRKNRDTIKEKMLHNFSHEISKRLELN